MEFRILGPLEVHGPEGELPLSGIKQRAVLAVLLLHANQPVTADRLALALWGEEAPERAVKTVRVHMARLRDALGAREAVITSPAGYRVSVRPGELDADQFDRLVREGRACLQAGDAERAAALLREGLGLWRGAPLAELTSVPFAQTEIARLEEQRFTALELRIEAELAAGWHGSLVGELQRLVAEHPHRERLAGQLMLALYRSGRQADALAAYRATHAALVEDLGIEPELPLRQLHEAMLRQDAALAPAATPTPVTDPDGAGDWPRNLPLAPRLKVAHGLGFVGRSHERALLTEQWRAARDGARQAVLISGEPGIGKTRLAGYLACEWHEAGATVLFGRAAEEITAPYCTWIELLSPLVEHAPQAVLAEHQQRYGSGLARLLPAFAQRVPHSPETAQAEPEMERYLLFAAVVGLVKRAARDAPLVLLLDDLHWADTQSLALLKHVIAETIDARLLVLVTYRGGEVHTALDQVLADLRREDGIGRVALTGLHEDAVVALTELAAGRPLDGAGQDLARQLATETGGNPFFIGEMLRNLAESGAVARDPGGHWALTRQPRELTLPQGVKEVVQRRVTRLGDHCRRVLTTAAVIGREFELDLLARAVRCDEDELIDVLEASVRATLVLEHPERAGAYAFAHNVINQTLYEETGSSRRSQLHRRVAEGLEADPAGGRRVVELARHWMVAADAANLDKALQYCRRAGEQALASLSPDRALEWFEHALTLHQRRPDGDPEGRCDLLIAIGEAQRQAGRPEFRGTLLEAFGLAERLADPQRAARAVIANSRGFASMFGVVDAERVAALERAIALGRGLDPLLRARMLALEAMELQFDPNHERRRALADEALELARRAGDPLTLAYVLHDHFHAVWSADTLATRRASADEMTQLAETTGDPLSRLWALDRRVHVAAESGDCRAAAAAAGRLLELTRELGQPGLRWHAMYYAAGLALMRGDLAGADRLTAAAAEQGGQTGEPDAEVIRAAQLFAIRLEQDRAAEIIATLGVAAHEHSGIAAFDAGLTAALSDVGRADDARRRLEVARDGGFAAPRNQVYTTALAAWARASALVADERSAAALYDLILPWQDNFVWNGTTGAASAHSYLGMLAVTLRAHDRAATHFTAADALHARAGVKGWPAWDRYFQAAGARAAGEPGRAEELASAALQTARADGWGTAARHAEHLLHAIREEIGERTPTAH